MIERTKEALKDHLGLELEDWHIENSTLTN
jgi:hypothetical protein